MHLHIIQELILQHQSGTPILASISGTVTLAKFNGSGGYTVIIKGANNFSTVYCHVSPTFLVYVGQEVRVGDVVAMVGPKNVYDIYNNPYKDANGNPTNGATTGPHLHFTLKKDGIAVNPLNYVSYMSSSSSSIKSSSLSSGV